MGALLSVMVVSSGIPTFADTVSQEDFYYYETQSYNDYLQKNNSSAADSDIVINVFKYRKDSENVKITKIDSEEAVEIKENGILNLDFTVPQEGYYNLELDFYPLIAASSAIRFELAIDGEIPFGGASYITLKRNWKESGKIEKDLQGNQIRSSSVQDPYWVAERVEDESGLALEPYKFFLSKGKHAKPRL